jgi:hypothetical protein
MDFNNMLIEDIAKLNDSDRVLAWKHFLWRELTQQQREAILKAHYIWTPDVNWEYTKLNKIKKYNILRKEGWFTEYQARILIEKRICGKLSSIINNSAENLLKEWRIEELANTLSNYENLNLFIAQELIKNWYKKEVLENIRHFDLDSIVDILPNKDKIIDFYREIKLTWKVQILEWEYWIFEKASNYKIWNKSANETDWLCTTSSKLKSYTIESLASMWINLHNQIIKQQFDDWVRYVEKLETKINQIKIRLEESSVLFDNLIDDIWKQSYISSEWTDLSNSWKKVNWIHNKVPLKWLERIMEKILVPWFFDWDINKLWDIIRWSLEYDNITELYKWLYALMEHWLLSDSQVRIFIKDNIWNLKWPPRHFQEYRDVNCTLKMSDGTLAELQFQIKSILEANNIWINLKAWTIEKINFTNEELWLSWKWKPNINIPDNNNWVVWHKIYELWRSISVTTESNQLKTLKEKLNNLLIEIHRQAWRKQFNN